jgi:hypothetical protein
MCDFSAYDVVSIQKVAGFSVKYVKLMSEINHQDAKFASAPQILAL